MITSVNLNHQFLFQTSEISNIIANCMLSSEMVSTIQLPEFFPQHSFGFSHLLTILLGKIFQ